ncbi:MAG: hypothetical protein HYY86_03215 [Candidatus Harrisonbacteria bacterium]|nr:hypothetical protein [Candidatus Harrisonbacteria bacterium]
MTLKTRRILFYALAAVFPLIGATAIFYSNGWRFDPTTLTITRLGGIFFENLPAGATVKLGKKELNFEPGLLKSGLLISDLFPKIYTAEISKTGYQTWIKEIAVAPSLVTEIPPVVLLPEKLQLGAAIKTGVKNFWTSPNYLVIQKNDRTLEVNGQKIIGTEITGWSTDQEAIITRTGGTYFLTDLRRPASALNLNLTFSNGKIKKIQFHPQNNNQFIIQTEKGLYLLNTEALTSSQIAKGDIMDFLGRANQIIFAQKSKLVFYDLNSKQQEVIPLNEKIGLIANLIASPLEELIVAETADRHLYLADQKSVSLLADNGTNPQFSPNGKLISFITSYKELVIYGGQPPKFITLLIGASDENAVTWHKNSHYLFIKYASDLYLLEGNDAPPINLQIIGSEIKKYQYLPEKNSVYLLKEGSLYSFDLQ